MRLLIIIVFICYYTGIIAYIAFQLSETAFTHQIDWFGPNFGFYEKSTSNKIITMAYFSFTTLSTVGFGDYYPVTSGERIFMIFIMVGGIMCFSYIMGLFTEILNVFGEIDSNVEEYD